MNPISSTKILFTRHAMIAALLSCLLTTFAQAGQWKTLGPDGGDVRHLAYDPQNPDRIYLGTSSGQLFLSTDGGASWSRFAHLGAGQDYVLDHIIIDPTNSKTIYVSAFSIEDEHSGDLFRSHDGGKNWEPVAAMHGKSIRALAMAPSDSKVLVAGALDGVFRSNDGGKNWTRISPENHADIKNIQSLAIDPRDPDTIYAGTWHLAWKTSDNGKSWHQIKRGVIDDSDVFSLIVDRNNPSVMYLSACSGIYKSESAGELFHKMQGIPFSARRTRVLMMDPTNSDVVYAGTTEGLWKTVDAGRTWKRTSPPNLILNSVIVDPRKPSRVLLGTDRSGVLVSNDSARTLEASNNGFAHRQVASMIVDNRDANVVYAGLINDKEFGGVFVSRDAGEHWSQMSKGLGGGDVFSVRQTDSGALLAGTNRGIFMWDVKRHEWMPANYSMENVPVAHLEVTPKRWFLASSTGLYRTTDRGQNWVHTHVSTEHEFIAVHASGEMVAAATRHGVYVSDDGGVNWTTSRIPGNIAVLTGMLIGPESSLWIHSREGAFRSINAGRSWEPVRGGLPGGSVTSFTYDESRNRMLATVSASNDMFESRDGGLSWHRAEGPGLPLRTVLPAGSRMFAATTFDGIVAQPEQGDMTAVSRPGGSSE